MPTSVLLAVLSWSGVNRSLSGLRYVVNMAAIAHVSKSQSGTSAEEKKG